MHIRLYGQLSAPGEITVELAKESSQTGIPFVKKVPSKVTSRLPGEGKLPLRLVGIYKHGEEIAAYIENLISFKTGEYKVGDKLLGARVIQIRSGQVALLKGGQRIILTLENPYSWSRSDDWIDSITQDNFVVSRKRLAQKARGINELLQEAIPTPHISGGRIDGFYIRFLKKGGFIHQAGFQEGDIIKSINGQKLDSIKGAISAYESLRNLVRNQEKPIIKIQLQRGDKLNSFTYRILE